MKIGIVGLPNVGKSTLFNAMTHAEVEAKNYPFCTIDPHIGNVCYEDERLHALAAIVKPEHVLPSSVQFIDIAGLVQGAAQGEGLGNRFLSHIREVDAIVHVVRCFDHSDVTHVMGHTDPRRDMDIINNELIFADLETVLKSKKKKMSPAESRVLDALAEHLGRGMMAKDWLIESDEIKNMISSLHLLTQKPLIYLANIKESMDDRTLHYLNEVQRIAPVHRASVLPLSIQWSYELSLLDPQERRCFIEESDASIGDLQRLIEAGYRLLNLETFFTVGPKEVRAWKIPKGTVASKAASVIHTDFEKGFIKASVIAYCDFIDCQGESKAKALGKQRFEGKDYIVQDGDVIHFMVNA